MGRQRLLQLLIMFFAGAWSIALGVLGLWLLFEPHSGLFGRSIIAISAGLGAICAAQLVFFDCIAIRLFPRPHPTISGLTRGVNAVTLGGSLCVLLVAVLGASV